MTTNNLYYAFKDAKQSFRKKESKQLIDFDTDTLMRITTQIAIEHGREFKMLSSTIINIGREILMPYETTDDLSILNPIRAKVGWDLLQVLIDNKLIARRKQKFQPAKGVTLTKKQIKGKQQRMPWIVMIANEIACDEIYKEITFLDDNYIPTSWKPQYKTPEWWLEPKHPKFGDLIRNANPLAKESLTMKKTPLIYKCINKLQKTPLRVSNDVLDAALHSLQDDILTFNDFIDKETGEILLDDAQKETMYRKNAKALETAMEIGDKRFYTGYYLDFRYRVYPTMQHLNILGDDLQKGLIRLGYKKAITREGIEWLKLFIANCCDEKVGDTTTSKLPIDDRIKWTEKNWDRLKLMANYKTNKDWQKLEEPWTGLAAIIELNKCLSSPFPNLYRTDLITSCAFDATNSGAQWISIISKDKKGLEATNLTATDKIHDLYLEVADLVFNDESLSDFWKEHENIRRYCCKRPVMVKIYNCGVKTASKQLIEDLLMKYKIIVSKEQALEMATLIDKKLRVLLPGVMDVMDTFNDLADDFNDDGIDCQWKLPQTKAMVYQHYREDKKTKLVFRDGDKLINVNVMIGKDEVLREKKQRTAIIANITHSIDASLIHYIVSKTSYDVLPIHDCVMSHPADSGRLFEDLRIQTEAIAEYPIMKTILDGRVEMIEMGTGQLDAESNDYCYS